MSLWIIRKSMNFQHLIEFNRLTAKPIIQVLELPCEEYKVTIRPLKQMDNSDNTFSVEIKCNSPITAQAMIALISTSFDAIMYLDPNDATKIAINLKYIKQISVKK